MNQTNINPKFTISKYPILPIWSKVIKSASKVNKIVLLMILIMVLPTVVYGHRPIHGESNEIDACRIKVGYERIHFSAYTPTLTGSQNYCEAIPDIGPTNLVFDYEGKKLRNVTIEFEITKEPEGSRVFYQEPKKIKTGTVNALVDFSSYGAGNYLAHVTIVHKGKKLDQHIPFSVGLDQGFQISFTTVLIAMIIIGMIIYLMKRFFKDKKNDQPPMPQADLES